MVVSAVVVSAEDTAAIVEAMAEATEEVLVLPGTALPQDTHSSEVDSEVADSGVEAVSQPIS